ncbi:RNA polymerase sigma factor [Paenibacillus senegalensis]|uniref:RNA polymerase sigma factor n=1 Tax=Paenibacillus senegalensis TaxID=1465766 RepID=UPI000288317F|nr:RNA polymerase sigma factor [Paenibacillus senegalensis]
MEIDELIETVKLHGKSVYGFCYKLARNKEDADDLYQDTFLKAVELKARMDVNGNPKAFLISIAIRLHKNHRRKLAWRFRIAPTANLEEAAAMPDLFAAGATPEDTVLSLELRTIIQEAAYRLNDKLKLPLYMYYTADMSIEEIALALKIPEGTVKSRLHKARATMRKVLEVDPL